MRTAEEDEEVTASASPSKLSRLYPPHYAGVQAIEAHGDEELGTDLIPDEINDELFAGYGGEEDEDPPITSEEHVLQLLDSEARKVEVQRMLDIPAMEESTREEVAECGGYIISTKFVQTWKHRVERGGWFRSATGGQAIQGQCGHRANVRAHVDHGAAQNVDTHDAQRPQGVLGHDARHKGRLPHGKPT